MAASESTEIVKTYPIFEGVVLAIFFIVVWALKKQFASKEDVTAEQKELHERLQTVEQTYVKSTEFNEVRDTVKRIENDVDGLPEKVTKLGETMARVEEQGKHFNETLERIERPINLIIEAKLNEKD